MGICVFSDRDDGFTVDDENQTYGTFYLWDVVHSVDADSCRKCVLIVYAFI